MSENKHTQEPWHLCEVENETGRIKHLVPVDAEKMSLLTIVENDQATFAAIYNDDDARRIVACVNACAGVDPAWLETMAKVGGFAVMNQYIAAYNQAAAAIMAEKQRDELLAAAEAIEINGEECLDFDECTAMLVPIDDYHKLVEAIASVKGQK